jgi:hypothetical protein
VIITITCTKKTLAYTTACVSEMNMVLRWNATNTNPAGCRPVFATSATNDLFEQGYLGSSVCLLEPAGGRCCQDC